MNIETILPKPRQRALGFFLLAVILVGNVVWFKGMLAPLFQTRIFGDVDVLTVLSLAGLWVVWRLRAKQM